MAENLLCHGVDPDRAHPRCLRTPPSAEKRKNKLTVPGIEIIMRRYELRATMMTSNRPIEEWGKLVGDVPTATAILDRFLHHAQVIAITGRSYRLRDRAAKQARKQDRPAKKEDPYGKDA